MKYIRPAQEVEVETVTDDASVAAFVEAACLIPPTHCEPPKVLTWPGDIAVAALRHDKIVKLGPGRYRVYAEPDFTDAGYRAVDPEPPLFPGAEWCASRDRRHASTRLNTDGAYLYARDRSPGRRARTLCGNYGDDQERTDHQRRVRRRPTVDIMKLPLCVLCARSLAAAVITPDPEDPQ
jgi:hypothetical protein